MSDSYTRDLVSRMGKEIESIVPKSVIYAWDADVGARVTEKLTKLHLAVLVGMPDSERDGKPEEDEWKMTLTVTIESNPVTRGKSIDSFEISETILREFNSWSPESEKPHFPIFDVYATSIKHKRNGVNFVHTLTFTATYGLK